MPKEMSATERDAPIYQSFSELFDNGFELDIGTCVFVISVQVLSIFFAIWLFTYAPAPWLYAGIAWIAAHFFLGSISTTLYSHRLITHNAAKHVSAPVHWFFCAFGQVLSVQGSVRRWSANHALHHGVDRHGKKELDPYSATWFADSTRNFLWSHMVTHLFNHPQSEEYDRSHAAKRHAIIMWQDKWYGLLTTFWIFLFPMGLGFALGGRVGLFALMAASLVSTVLVQHNTWTVNSVTHMWGLANGVKSSAKNNYIWLGPMGEGNHHGDHHDFPRDFRNGFGISGWLLDPTRYLILVLRGLGLVKGLNRASKYKEAEIIAARKIAEVDSHASINQEVAKAYHAVEKRVLELKDDWLEALGHFEKLKNESKLVRSAVRGRNELARDLRAASNRVKACRDAFFSEINQTLSYA